MSYTIIGKVLYARFESESQRLRKNKVIQSNIHIQKLPGISLEKSEQGRKLM